MATPSKREKAVIVAIGTEITQGQITNRNAAWISERLTSLGIEVVLHETVADDRDEILEALERSARKAELVFVTGGLGPTSDDFTREVIAKWTSTPLEFRASSWEKIVQRLTGLGIEVAESNRQQCYFPAGATSLTNSEGTADGFRLTYSGSEIYVLPGPPREIAHLWERWIDSELKAHYPALSATRLETWKCLGKSESSLGEIVEAAASGYGVKTGYRASAPYVEVKIWIPSSLPQDRIASLIGRLDTELAPYSLSRNEEDVGEQFVTRLKRHTGTFSLTFLDVDSQGILTERMLGLFKSKSGREVQARAEIMTRYGESATPESLPEMASEWIFGLFPEGKVVALGPKGRFIRSLPNPYPAANEENALGDRLRRYRVEMALKAWSEILSMNVTSVGPSA